MKIKFYCDSGANIHSCNDSGWLDPNDLGYEEGEWEKLSDDDKYREAEFWANERLDIGYQEKE